MPKGSQRPLDFGQYIENHSGGQIHIHNNYQQSESLGPNRSVRWTPTEEDDLRQAMRRDGFTEFNPYVRSLTRIASHFSISEIDQLISDRALVRFMLEHKELFVKMFEAVRKA